MRHPTGEDIAARSRRRPPAVGVAFARQCSVPLVTLKEDAGSGGRTSPPLVQPPTLRIFIVSTTRARKVFICVWRGGATASRCGSPKRWPSGRSCRRERRSTSPSATDASRFNADRPAIVWTSWSSRSPGQPARRDRPGRAGGRRSVVRRSFVPERGNIVWLSFSPQLGREQAGRRPALVLSPRRYNERVGLALVCPITSRAKGYPFEGATPQRCDDSWGWSSRAICAVSIGAPGRPRWLGKHRRTYSAT